MGHDARSWEGHVDARWRLRHGVVFNGGLGLRGCFHLELVVVLWVVGVCLSFSNLWCLYPMWSQILWFRGWTCSFYWVGHSCFWCVLGDRLGLGNPAIWFAWGFCRSLSLGCCFGVYGGLVKSLV